MRFSVPAIVRTATIGAATILVGGLVSRHLLGSLNDPIAPLLGAIATHANPEPTTPLAKPSSRVVMIVLDGVGERALLPRAERGALGPLAAIIPVDTGLPSLSRPGYHVSLTGVPQGVSGVRTNFFAPARADSVVDRLHAVGASAAFLQEGVHWYGELFAKPNDLVSFGPNAGGVEALQRADAAGAALVVVHLTQADGAGHGSGAGSVGYQWTVDRQAESITALVKSVEGTAREAETRWLVGADHGHMQAGGHGGPEPEVTEVSWLLLAAGRDRGVPTHRVGVRQPATTIAPLVSQLLGIEPPRQSSSEPPPLPAQIAPPVAAPRMLLPRLFAIQEARESHARAVQRRMTLTGGFLILALAVAIARLSWRRLAGAFAPTLGACAAFALAGPGFTLSAIQTERVYLQTCLWLLAVGSALAWLAARRLGATIGEVLGTSLLPALAALALTAGSLGTSDLGPVPVLLLSSTGLLPPGVALGVSASELLVRVRSSWRRRRESAADPSTPQLQEDAPSQNA